MANSNGLLQFSGHQYFRHRLALSFLSGKPVKIDKIRPEDKNPGLRGHSFSYAPSTYRKQSLTLNVDYEVSLLRLLERATNGTVIEISYTGTQLLRLFSFAFFMVPQVLQFFSSQESL